MSTQRNDNTLSLLQPSEFDTVCSIYGLHSMTDYHQFVSNKVVLHLDHRVLCVELKRGI